MADIYGAFESNNARLGGSCQAFACYLSGNASKVLREACPKFREWWEQHEVQDWSSAEGFEHPDYGVLTFEYTGFKMVDQNHPDLMLLHLFLFVV